MKVNDKVSIAAEIKIWRKTHEWNTLLYNYFNEIIEAVVSTHGSDLDRETAIQEGWLFVIKLIPKAKLKKNFGAYFYTCLRHYISDLREDKIKHTYTSLQDIKEPEAKNG